MTKICPQCGTEFTFYGRNQNSRKYCSKECYSEANRKRSKDPAVRRMCKRYDCIYHPYKGADNSCDYTIITDKIRPCPPGEGCTCYEYATPTERKRRQVKTANKIFKGGYY